MAWVEPVVSGGLTLAGILGKHGAQNIDIDAIIRKWQSMPTRGELTPEDYAFANANYQQGAEAVGQRRTGRRAMAAASLAAKGLSLSPASERIQQEDDSVDAGALTNLSRERGATLYGVQQNREAANRNFNLQAMMQEISGQKYNAARQDAARGGYFNSLLEAAPNFFNYFKGLGGVPGTDIAPAGNTMAHGGLGDIPLPSAPASRP